MKFSEKKGVYYDLVTFRFLHLGIEKKQVASTKEIQFQHIIVVKKKRYEKESNEKKTQPEFWLEHILDPAVSLVDVKRLDEFEKKEENHGEKFF